MSKQENAKKALKILEEAWKTKSAILVTDDYLYVVFQLEPGKWQETSFVFEDSSLDVRQCDPEEMLMLLIEEITTGLPGYDSYTVVSDNESRTKVIERIQTIASS